MMDTLRGLSFRPSALLYTKSPQTRSVETRRTPAQSSSVHPQSHRTVLNPLEHPSKQTAPHEAGGNLHAKQRKQLTEKIAKQARTPPHSPCLLTPERSNVLFNPLQHPSNQTAPHETGGNSHAKLRHESQLPETLAQAPVATPRQNCRHTESTSG